MSGSPKGLPRAEWLKWLQDVFNPHRRAVSETFTDHDERLSSNEAATVALGEAQAAQGERVGALEARVRALEEADGYPGPDPEPEPEPDPEPPARVLEGVGSVSTSLKTHPRIRNETVGDWYVDGSASRSGNGRSLESPFRTIQEGLAALQDGQTLLVRGGVYELSERLNRRAAWSRTTRIMGYGTERPILDASGFRTSSDSPLRFQNSARNELWHRFYVRNVNANDGRGVIVNGDHITLSQLWFSHLNGTAVHVGQGNTGVTVLDCAAWRLGDGSSQHTNVPDGFVATAWTTGVHTRADFVRCFVDSAPDDGFDLWGGRACEILDSVARSAGRYWNGVRAGDGNAFKLGGDNRPGGKGAGRNNTARGCLSLDARALGFNHNIQGADSEHTLVNNTSVQSGGHGFDPGTRSVVRNNVSHQDRSTHYQYGSSSYAANSWQLGVTSPRFANPDRGDFSLSPGSPAVGAGVDGENLGASTAALEINAVWSQRDLTGYGDVTWPDVPHSEEAA